MSCFIEVNLTLNLRKYSRKTGSSFSLEIDPGTTVRHVIHLLSLPVNEPLLFIVNGSQAFLETQLTGGDTLKVLPLLAGG